MAGLFHPIMEGGSKVEKGMVLGLVADPYGDQRKHVKAPFTGQIIGVNTSPVVNQGDALFHLGLM